MAGVALQEPGIVQVGCATRGELGVDSGHLCLGRSAGG